MRSKVGAAVLGTFRKTKAGAVIPSFITDRPFALFFPEALPGGRLILAGLPGRVKPLLGSTARMLCRTAISARSVFDRLFDWSV